MKSGKCRERAERESKEKAGKERGKLEELDSVKKSWLSRFTDQFFSKRKPDKTQQFRVSFFHDLLSAAPFKDCLKSNPFWYFSYETTYETVCFLTDAQIKDLTALILMIWTVSKRGVFETV